MCEQPVTNQQNLGAALPAGKERPTAPAKNPDALRESAKLAIEFTKQFLTLAVGAVAFVVGLLSSNADVVPTWLGILCLMGFAGSVICGIFFFMGSVWEINQKNNFDVFTPKLQRLANLQLLLFFLFVAVVGFFAVKRAYSMTQPTLVTSSSRGSTNFATLDVQIGSNIIRQPVFEKSKISLIISNNHVSMEVVPQL